MQLRQKMWEHTDVVTWLVPIWRQIGQTLLSDDSSVYMDYIFIRDLLNKLRNLSNWLISSKALRIGETQRQKPTTKTKSQKLNSLTNIREYHYSIFKLKNSLNFLN